jgi:hypothetical protein
MKKNYNKSLGGNKTKINCCIWVAETLGTGMNYGGGQHSGPVLCPRGTVVKTSHIILPFCQANYSDNYTGREERIRG